MNPNFADGLLELTRGGKPPIAEQSRFMSTLLSNRSDGLIIVGRYKDRARIAMNVAASLVAGLVVALVLGIWLYAITIWLFVH
jgi:hypothetical protein